MKEKRNDQEAEKRGREREGEAGEKGIVMGSGGWIGAIG